MYPHVLVVRHWSIEVIVDDVRRQVVVPFVDVVDGRVEVDTG